MVGLLRVPDIVDLFLGVAVCLEGPHYNTCSAVVIMVIPCHDRDYTRPPPASTALTCSCVPHILRVVTHSHTRPPHVSTVLACFAWISHVPTCTHGPSSSSQLNAVQTSHMLSSLANASCVVAR